MAPAARRSGVGRALIDAARERGLVHGCGELASDTEIAKEASAGAHRAAGFEEAGILRCFRMDLSRREEAR